MAATHPTGVHEVSALPFARRFVARVTTPMGGSGLLVILGFQFASFFNVFLRESFGWWPFVIALVLYLLALLAITIVATRRNPPPVLDFDRGEMRIGSDVTPFAELTDALAINLVYKKVDDLVLDVAGSGHRHAQFVLRSRRRTELTSSERELVAAMLERSGIRIPEPKRDPYDPTGKFAWMDVPHHRTREQAIELVLNTPESGDRVSDERIAARRAELDARGNAERD